MKPSRSTAWEPMAQYCWDHLLFRTPELRAQLRALLPSLGACLGDEPGEEASELIAGVLAPHFCCPDVAETFKPYAVKELRSGVPDRGEPSKEPIDELIQGENDLRRREWEDLATYFWGRLRDAVPQVAEELRAMRPRRCKNPVKSWGEHRRYRPLPRAWRQDRVGAFLARWGLPERFRMHAVYEVVGTGWPLAAVGPWDHPKDHAEDRALHLALPAYNPALVTWQEYKDEAWRAVQAQLEGHRVDMERLARWRGLRDVPASHERARDVEWVLRHHYLRETQVDIGRRDGADAQAVTEAIKTMVKRLGLTVAPRRGRPKGRKDATSRRPQSR